MKVETEQELKVTLVMSEEQASWLKGVMQNELMVGEDSYDRRLREEFWEVLSQIKELK